MLYYEDYDTLSEDTRRLMQQSMAAFGGNAPTYHIALMDNHTIIWDFHSMLLGVQMMLSFMLIDSKNPIRLCRHCTKAFVASRPSAVFCSPQCKNKHNVYKSRARERLLRQSPKPLWKVNLSSTGLSKTVCIRAILIVL